MPPIYELLGISQGTAVMLLVGGAVAIFVLGSKTVREKLFGMVRSVGIKTRLAPATASGDVIERGLDLAKDLAKTCRIADAKKVLDIIDGIQQEAPTVQAAGPSA